jgi:hypothetical protein
MKKILNTKDTTEEKIKILNTIPRESTAGQAESTDKEGRFSFVFLGALCGEKYFN